MDNPVYNLSKREYQLCLILWQNPPVTSTKLVELCHTHLNWKKSTTYTYIRRLTQKGILQCRDAWVKILVSKDTIQIARVEACIESTFEGSASDLLSFLEKYYIKKS